MSRRRPVHELDRCLSAPQNILLRVRVLDEEMVLCSYEHYLPCYAPVSKSRMPEPEQPPLETKIGESETSSYQDLFCKIAKKHTPPDVRVIWKDPLESYDGKADQNTREMFVPHPDSMENLLIYLHECAHFFLHRNDEAMPYYLKEFQAETWALDKMQAEGLTLPDELVLASQKRIYNDIRGAVKNRIKRLDRRAFEFARPYFQDYELEEYLKLVSD